MTPKQQREEISKAYVAAVAARCGFKLASWSQDDDCLDVTIGAPGVMGRGTLAGPKLDVQLKCSSKQRRDQGEHITWSLKRAHYDVLRAAACVPRILVVVLLPEDEDEWVEHSPDALIVRRCGWWTSLLGKAEISGDRGTKSIKIPKSRSFSPAALRTLMTRISRGEEI